MFMPFMLFAMFIMATGKLDDSDIFQIAHVFTKMTLCMNIDHLLVRLSVIIHVKWVCDIGV